MLLLLGAFRVWLCVPAGVLQRRPSFSLRDPRGKNRTLKS